MMRPKKPFAEIGIDSRHQVLDITGFRNFPHFVHKQAMSVTVKPLTLSKPEQSVSVNNQSGVPSTARIDSYRVLLMCSPSGAQRRIAREQV
jgi:hypothetical protein